MKFSVAIQSFITEKISNVSRILAIDPGLRNSCGWCVSEINSKTGSVDVLEYGVFDVKKMSITEIGSTLDELLNKYQISNVFIERFRFYTGFANTEKPSYVAAANGATVVRMTEFIFFLFGWFSKGNYTCTLETSNVWKKKLDAGGKTVVEQKLRKLIAEKLQIASSKVDAHWMDALGMTFVAFNLTFDESSSPNLVFRVSKPIKQSKVKQDSSKPRKKQSSKEKN